MKMEFAALACTVSGFLVLGDLGSSMREVAEIRIVGITERSDR